MPPTEHPRTCSTISRIVTGGFGVLFIGLALAILVTSEISFGVLIAAFVVGGLGMDAIVSAFRGRTSLLARIGPLP